MPLKGNETIRDILTNLASPEKYARSVLANMVAFRKLGHGAAVRIGTTGDGIAPNYQIEPASDTSNIDRLISYSENHRAFHGRSHQPTEWSFNDIRSEHWSSESMSIEDVQMLIGEITGFKR